MRDFRHKDTDKLYRVVMEGNVTGSDKKWQMVFGPYTSLPKAREGQSRYPTTEPSRTGSYHETWIEETPATWTRVS